MARGPSPYAAPAALALIDAGFAAPPGNEQTREAVRARQAVGGRAGERRRTLMLDADASVRRAALSAALVGRDRADIGALADAARLDPDPEARALAIRALGRIGGELAVLALIDVSASATPAERRQIAQSWSAPSTYAVGGQTELEDLARGDGEPSVLGALALLAHSQGSALAAAALVRAIEGSDVPTRLLAIEAAPWSDVAVRAALGAARAHKDPATRVLSLWRFALAGALDATALGELEQLASDTVTPVGGVARAALAHAGKRSVQPALRADLGAHAADRRTLAARALLDLGDWAGAARALGDDSPRVRRAVACEMLTEPRSERPLPAALPPPPGSGAPGAIVPLLLSAVAG